MRLRKLCCTFPIGTGQLGNQSASISLPRVRLTTDWLFTAHSICCVCRTQSLWQPPQLRCGHGTEQQPPEMGLLCTSCEFVGWGAGFRWIGCMGAPAETPHSGDILASAASYCGCLGSRKPNPSFGREPWAIIRCSAHPHQEFFQFLTEDNYLGQNLKKSMQKKKKGHNYLKSTQWNSYFHLWQTC